MSAARVAGGFSLRGIGGAGLAAASSLGCKGADEFGRQAGEFALDGVDGALMRWRQESDGGSGAAGNLAGGNQRRWIYGMVSTD